ncbi:hypothetical protein ACNIZD_26485, partial [Escherichia coli]
MSSVFVDGNTSGSNGYYCDSKKKPSLPGADIGYKQKMGEHTSPLYLVCNNTHQRIPVSFNSN